MMNDDDVVVSGASGRETVEDLRRSGALDALFSPHNAATGATARLNAWRPITWKNRGAPDFQVKTRRAPASSTTRRGF